ncbi:MAG: dethiobiotin synthase [Phycisphaeraceae bacterium]|nr:dethiobiotin synthase [Phycisphaeraceae bacterium]
MFSRRLELTRPGLFVTGTDTEVGKTVVACSVAWHLRRAGRVGVSKPIATGCRRDREGLVSEDAEALAHFSDCRQPLERINPVRYRAPVAPAVAAAQTGQPVDFDAVEQSLGLIDRASDVVVVEGVGGLLVPLDRQDRVLTVLDLIQALGYPVLVVSRAGLGTLNHTAMTVRLLKEAGCRVAGLVINGYQADSSGRLDARRDLAMATNPRWMELMTATEVRATVPQLDTERVDPAQGRIAGPVLDAMGQQSWLDLADVP